MKNNYKVYKHISPNGKVYIGITKRNVEDRWNDGKGYKGNEHFYRAIQKYGWNNFNHEILFENLTKEEACQKEIELIAEYKSNNFEYGYNICAGGEGRLDSRQTEETKKLISEASKQHWENPKIRDKIISKLNGHITSEETKKKISESNKLYWKDKEFPEETKQKISKANKGKTAWNKGMKGLKRSEETKQKISNTLKGRHISEKQKEQISKCHKGKIISQETRDKISNSLKEYYKNLRKEE